MYSLFIKMFWTIYEGTDLQRQEVDQCFLLKVHLQEEGKKKKKIAHLEAIVFQNNALKNALCTISLDRLRNSFRAPLLKIPLSPGLKNSPRPFPRKGLNCLLGRSLEK